VPAKLHAVGMSIERFIRPFLHRNRTELSGVHAEVEPDIDVDLSVYLLDCGPRLIAPLYPKCEDFGLLEGSRLREVSLQSGLDRVPFFPKGLSSIEEPGGDLVVVLPKLLLNGSHYAGNLGLEEGPNVFGPREFTSFQRLAGNEG